MYSHVSIGNINLDIHVYLSSLPYRGETIVAQDLVVDIGGAAVNYAFSVSRGGHKAYLLGYLGEEVFHNIIRTVLSKENVDTRFVQTLKEFPGIVIVLNDKDGERTMIKYRGANRDPSINDIKAVIESGLSFDVIHIASRSAILVENIQKLTKTIRKNIILSYDPGGVYAKKERAKIKRLLANNNSRLHLFFNEREALEIFEAKSIGDFISKIDRIEKSSETIIAVKRGEKGAIVIAGDKCLKAGSRPARKLVDTTGAGDVFDAYFNLYYLETESLEQALRAANIAGSLMVEKRGSASAVPARSVVEAEINNSIIEVSSCT